MRSPNIAAANAASADWSLIPDCEAHIVISPDHRDGSAGGGGSGSNLKLRIASAAVLAPLALVCAYLGGWFFLLLCVIAGGGILWEWASLVTGEADPRVLVPGWAGMLIAAALASINLAAAAAGTIAIEGVLAALAVAALPRNEATPGPVVWAIGGVVYAGIAMLAPIMLRRDPQWGLTVLLFLFATVWITDIFAYFFGRFLRGPLLAPRISPNKTWSGAVGGLFGGVVGGVAVAYASGLGKLGILGVMALVLSVLAQAGDLFESAIKRHFGAKDTSGLIPGHGGLMDRLDGFIVAAFAALLIGIVRQGTATPARGFLIW
jgi:phosphatidate cytidylyltransferase